MPGLSSLMRLIKGTAVFLSATALLFVLSGCSGVGVATYHENGVVATAAPIASEVGLQVLRDGGNAVDAAVAVALAMAVVHPEAGNLGGGGFALIHTAAESKVEALDFREVAPAAATDSMYLDSLGEVIPNLSTHGALACGVPGTVAGLHEMWQRYGSRPWEELVTVAAMLADTGFVVDPCLSESLDKYADGLKSFPATERQFFPNGQSPRPGDKFRQPDLARTLYGIAADGPSAFYQGEVADKIVACMTAHGGLITREDLTGYAPVWRTPLRFAFDSLDIYSMPPPSSGGICMGQILHLLEPFDFSRFTVSSPEYMHLFAEAARLAFADRSQYLGDPDFHPVPTSLLDESYLERRRKLIDEQHAGFSQQVRPGEPPGTESMETTHFCVCDSAGNIVSLTYTLNTAYGCKLVVEGAGFLLNNEMDDFALKPGHPNVYGLVGGEANKIEPGKRMLSSMSPTIVMKRGRPWLVLGSPGGSKIITTVAEAIVAFSRFGLPVREVVALPRFHHQWLPDILSVEQGGFDINVVQRLIGMGHNVQDCEPYGDLQMIHIMPEGFFAGASDPRRGGRTAGF